LLGRVIARPRKRVHRALLITRDLRDDMRRNPEAVDPDPPPIARHAQRAITE
jgi:hypothetical protein